MAAALLTATDAADAPPPGTWAIDPGRAVVAFSGRAGFLAPTISARFATVCRRGHRRRTRTGSASRWTSPR